MRPIFVAALFLSTAAFAQSQTPTPRTVDFTTPLLDVSGNPVKDDTARTQSEYQADPRCEKCRIVTIGMVVAGCIVADDKAPAEQKPALWEFARRIIDSKAASLSEPEIHTIKTCVDKKSVTVAGQIDPLVDPSFKPEAVK